jgi:hypothetical protein
VASARWGEVFYDDVKFEVFTAVITKNAVFWYVTPCDSCENLSEESVASIIRVKKSAS